VTKKIATHRFSFSNSRALIQHDINNDTATYFMMCGKTKKKTLSVRLLGFSEHVTPRSSERSVSARSGIECNSLFGGDIWVS
jgi:hypothetical protein